MTLMMSAGVFTLVDFYFHVAGLQPAFEEAQQQAAAAGGHYASEAQATLRVDVGDNPQASNLQRATIMVPMPANMQSFATVQFVLCGHSSKVTRYRRC